MPVPQSGLDELLVPDLSDLMSTLSAQTGPRFRRLNAAMAGLLDDYSMIGFSALDVSDEESIGEVLMQVPDGGDAAIFPVSIGALVRPRAPE